MKLAYADPPYPGKAHLYPEQREVDHGDVEDTLAYVAVREGVLDPGDPLAVLADVVKAVSRHFNSNALAPADEAKR